MRRRACGVGGDCPQTRLEELQQAAEGTLDEGEAGRLLVHWASACGHWSARWAAPFVLGREESPSSQHPREASLEQRAACAPEVPTRGRSPLPGSRTGCFCWLWVFVLGSRGASDLRFLTETDAPDSSVLLKYFLFVQSVSISRPGEGGELGVCPAASSEGWSQNPLARERARCRRGFGPRWTDRLWTLQAGLAHGLLCSSRGGEGGTSPVPPPAVVTSACLPALCVTLCPSVPQAPAVSCAHAGAW